MAATRPPSLFPQYQPNYNPYTMGQEGTYIPPPPPKRSSMNMSPAEGMGSVLSMFSQFGGSATPGMEAVGTLANGSPMMAPAAEGTGGLFGAGTSAILPVAATLAANKAGRAATEGTKFETPYAALNAVNPLNWGMELGENFSDLKHGGKFDTAAQTALAVPSGGLSFLQPKLAEAFGTGKDKDQQGRDKIKEFWRDKGLVTENWGLPIAGGKEYELRDNPEFWTPSERATSIAGIADYAEPLAYLMTDGDEKHLSPYTGWLMNAGAEGATDLEGAKENFKAMYSKLGNAREILTPLYQKAKDKKIAKEDYLRYFAAIKALFGR
jgi:hypothetical protein